MPGPAPRILALAGATRSGSFNKKLVRIAARGAERAGAEVTFVDLRDHPMPLYDGDLEAEKGIPEPALALRRLMCEHDGFLWSCPEYNSSVTGVLKNAIDWVSRPIEGDPPLIAFRGKIVALMSASPGALGGLRGLVHVRAILGNLGCIVLPDQVAVMRAGEAFDERGELRDEGRRADVEGLGSGLAEVVAKLGA